MALNKILLSDNVTELANVKSVVFKESVNAGECIHPGTVGSASIEVEVYGSQSTAVSAGDVVYYYQIDKNNTQTLIGQFICEPVIATKTSYKFVAHDNAIKLDADFSQWLRANQGNFQMTIYSLVSAACTVAGVTLGSTSWNLSTENVQAFYADGLTCRDILSYAAELGCCFVRCHSDGEVYFDWFSTVSNTIAPTVGTNQYAYKQDGLTYANYTTATLDCVVVHQSGNDDTTYIYPTGVTSGNTIHIQDNLLLTDADATLYNTVAQNVYTIMSALGTYRPMSAELFIRENPFRAGDVVSVTDIQSVSFSAPITSMTVTSASATLESAGREQYEEEVNTKRSVTQLASSVRIVNTLATTAGEVARQAAEDAEQNGLNITEIRETYASEVELTAALNQIDVVRTTVADLTDQYGAIVEENAVINQNISSIQQTADDLTLNFTTLSENLNNVDGELDAYSSWIQADSDGLTLGNSASNIQLEITNDGIAIIVDGQQSTYWNVEAQQTPQTLIIPEGGSFTLGNFRFAPRASGNLSLVKV